MNKILRVGQIGVGDGVSSVHLESNKALADRGLVARIAVAETATKKYADRLKSLRADGVSTFVDWKDMIDQRGLDAIVVSVPHHLHVPIGTYALNKGIHVFTEKPPAVTVESAQEFIKAMKQNQKIVGVNYMYTAAASAVKLKKLIQQGGLGKIKNIIAKGLWARSDEYYEQRAWRGKYKFDGQPLRDGCLYNQFPHLLNQCIYFLPGDGVPLVTNVKAELYRAHNRKYTEMEDTVSLNAKVNGVDVLLYCTVCNPKDEDLTLEVIGEKGKAYWSHKNLSIEYNQRTPLVSTYPNETWESMCQKMYENFVNRINAGTGLIWDLEQALVLTDIVSQAHQGKIIQIPKRYAPSQPLEVGGETAGSIRAEGEEHLPVIADIKKIITEAAARGKMFSQMDIPWAKYKG